MEFLSISIKKHQMKPYDFRFGIDMQIQSSRHLRVHSSSIMSQISQSNFRVVRIHIRENQAFTSSRFQHLKILFFDMRISSENILFQEFLTMQLISLEIVRILISKKIIMLAIPYLREALSYESEKIYSIIL